MAKRGFLAELAHQQRLAERDRLARARYIAQQAEAEARTQRAQQRLENAQARHEIQMAALEVSQRAYEARLTLQQRVDAENAARSAQFAAIDSILAAAVDAQPFRIADFITPAEHPPFDPGGLDKPTPKPKRQAAPPEPVYEAPPPLSGLSKMFGKKQH